MSKNLCQRIIEVMSEMGAIAKGGKADQRQGGYEFHKIDDVDDRLRQALIKHGVVLVPGCVVKQDLESYENNGKTVWSASCVVEFELLNADNPEETLSFQGWGQGLDYSDKATGKAMAYAAKSAYLSAFHLRGQPDVEVENVTSGKAKRLTAKELRYVDAFRAATSVDELNIVGEQLCGEDAKTQNAVRPYYKGRKQELAK